MTQEFKGPLGEVYTLGSKLGHGSFGVVYRATTPGKEPVAIKVIQAGYDSRENAALQNDINHAKMVSHPNVVRVIHAHSGDQNCQAYVMMELVEGGTLKKVIDSSRERNEQIEISEAIEMMRKIASGMEAINSHLIHRDLKPDNILVSGDQLKIADFGISKIITESTRNNTFKGGQHIYYMAPEAWKNETNSIGIDIYAAGLVFYEILLSEHPFMRAASSQFNRNVQRCWEQEHLFGTLGDINNFRKDVPLRIRQLLLKMISKRESDRPRWPEILDKLNDEKSENLPTNTRLLEIAISSISKQSSQALEDERRQEEVIEAKKLYHFSCNEVLSKFDTVVDRFNCDSQLGKIVTSDRSDRNIQFDLRRRYTLPTGSNIEVSFFSPMELTTRLGNIVGGGRIVTSNESMTGNLVLVKSDKTDLYGEWSICFVKLHGLVDPERVIGQYGLTRTTTMPFGFKYENDFKKEICKLDSMHIFKYEFEKDIASAFEKILGHAFAKEPPKSR